MEGISKRLNFFTPQDNSKNSPETEEIILLDTRKTMFQETEEEINEQNKRLLPTTIYM